MDPQLRPFFEPQGIALIGASHEPGKLGYGVAANLVQGGYRGAIHFINPRGGTLFDRPVYVDIAAVPDPVDLAVLLIPASVVPETIRACGRRGIRAVIVLSGGFREIGSEGAALEAACARAAEEFGIRLIGPNCVGVIDTHLPMDTTFLPPPGPSAGDVAFISHSGAICAAVTDWASGQGFGLSHLISLGNQLDLTETDVLEPVAEDPHTRVLTLYLEGVTNGRRFVDVAKQVTRRKPVIALKVGRSVSGQRAVASHTGALAGQEAAYNAAFERAGVLRADTSEEMFNWARALAWCPAPAGDRVAVLTNAGGPGVIAADAIEAQGLHLAPLADHTMQALRDLLPPFASVHNPVDILASATPEQYATSLELLLADPSVCGVIVILPPPPRDPAEAVADRVIPVINESAKPVLIALMGEQAIRAASERFRRARIPDYRFPEQAASALAVLVRHAAMQHRVETPTARFVDVRTDLVRALIETQRREFGDAFAQAPAARLLAAYGVRVAPMELARTPDEAVIASEHLGFPVALKIASPDIAHKSDVGGVALNVADRVAVASDFGGILTRARSARPEARIHGVCVQPMQPHGQEVIVGVIQDPQFGPLVMFGSGGVEVEGLHDVAFALAPLSREDAERLVDGTWAGRRLRGDRNLGPADREAVVRTVLRLGQMAADFPELSEIEINPLLVLPNGRGAVAVDIRITLRQMTPEVRPAV